MTALFIADLHLSPDRPGTTRAFLDFLERRASRAEALYILGDLFEAWIGDDDPSELARTVIDALQRLSRGGTALFFLHGNRDFLVGRRFGRKTGAQLLPEVHVANLYGQPVLLLHGDSLCLADEAYQRFRRRVRNPAVRWLLRHLPLRRRLQIAADWRRKSMQSNSNKADHIMDVSAAAVVELMQRHRVATMIHGHTHRPAVHDLTLNGRAARRIVLGDWGSLGWAVEASPHGLELRSFAIG